MVAFISVFIQWVYLIFKKWVWTIGLPLPLLEILSFYIPDFPQVEIPWQLSVSVGLCGFIISAFLVYRDQKLLLNRFLDNAPQFIFQISGLSQKICQGEKIHIDCNVRVTSQSPWLGILDNISLETREPPGFMGSGEISNMQQLTLGWQCPSLLKFPFRIPQNGVDIDLEIHFPFERVMVLSKRKIRVKTIVNLCFLIGYETPTMGYIQKCERVNIPLDFNAIEKLILNAREEI